MILPVEEYARLKEMARLAQAEHSHDDDHLAEPKRTHQGHPLRGALKELTHVPPGVDLTEPADPKWADRLDADDRRF